MKKLFLLAVLTAAFSASSLAQVSPDVEQGLKPYGAFQGGDLDTVNLTNGNLTLHIPLFSYPQRGGKLRLGFFIRYNNKGWYQFQVGHSKVWRYNGGSTDVVMDQPITVSWAEKLVTDFSGDQFWMKLYNAVTPDGSSHEILGTSGNFTNPDIGETADATGLRFESAGKTVVDRDGVRYSWGTVTQTFTDPNGNQITQNTSGWTDTLGRVFPGSVPTDGTYGFFNQNNLTPGLPSSTASCPSGTASARAWNLPPVNGGTAVIKLCYADFAYHTSFNQPGVIEAQGTYRLLNAVVLPNLTSWIFNYNAFLDLTSVTFPTGGTLTYTWATTSANTSRVIVSRALNANDGTGSHTWNYQWGVLINNVSRNVATDPAGNDLVLTPCSYASAYICQRDTYSGSYSAGTLLKTTTAQFHAENDPYIEYTGNDWPSFNVVQLSESLAWPGGLTSQSTTTFDAGFTYSVYHAYDGSTSTGNAYYGLPIQRTFSDFGGAPLKQSTSAYLWQADSNYLTANLLNLVQTSKTLDGGGNTCAETDYSYDDLNRLSLSNITTQHVAPPGPKRGNVSSIAQQLSSTPCQAGGSWRPVTSYVNAYDTGTTYQSIDPLGHTTTYAYSSSFAGAYPTQTQLNSTTTPGVSGSVQHVSSANFDFNTGLVTSATDENGNSTGFGYDSSSRLTQSSFADGGLLSFSYQDSSPFSVTVTRKITASLNQVSKAVVDGVGRVSETQLQDPDCTAGSGLVKVDFVRTEDSTAHDRLSKVSTPYCDSPNATFGLLAVTHADSLNRAKSLVQTDGSTASTSYSGNQTTIADEAGKQRKSQVDGLGRLTKVWEDPGGLNYETDYQYDPLGNLICAVQKGADGTPFSSCASAPATWRPRSFTYDSLSRLLTAANPESGTITYTYNDDGTVASKTMGKQNQTNPAVTVTATYSFDEIHRMTVKSFNDGSTSTIRYLYDGVTPTACTPPTLTAANPKPRRTAMCDGAGASAWSYDVVGREVTEKRATNGITKTTNYTYNLDGSVATLTYPSGRTITYTPNAAGRTVSAVDTANGISYATAAHYAPQGALASLQNGSGVVSTFYFNSRLQPCRISVKSSGTAPTQCSDTTNPGNVLDFSYSFSLGAGDNGNVVSIANNRDSTRTQNFTFDALNRLATAKTSSTSGATCWDEAFGYDPWANLLSIGRISGYSCTNEELLSVTATTNNRVSGNTYDAAGNLITVPSVASYTYNAENQLTTTAGVTYTYDGDGNRVSKSSGKLYWYGITSAPLAESDLSGNITSEFIFFDGKRIARLQLPAATVNYYFVDHLGTSRIVTDATGTVLDDSDFYPFGGERVVASSSGNTYKFNGKERDTESGLDDFGARYYNSSAGRWITPDWSARPEGTPYATLINPQTLNLYAMVQDNPVTFADLDGHACGGEECDESSEKKDTPISGVGGVIRAGSTSEAEKQKEQAQNQNQQKYDPSKTGPEDPTNPGKPLFQNPVVQKASDEAFMKTANGTARGGLAEAGFAIEYKDGKISIANTVDSVHSDKKANELRITTDDNTIAVLHTHGNTARPTPSMPTKDSPGDVGSKVPNFVRSQSALYVTVPGTTTFIKLLPAPSN